MRQLRDDTHLILDGEVRVYQRERSKRWQAAFVIDGHTIRISTGKRDLAEAKKYARETFLEYKFRHKNDLPVITKKFSDVAKLASLATSENFLVITGRSFLWRNLYSRNVSRAYFLASAKSRLPVLMRMVCPSITNAACQRLLRSR